MKYMFPAALLAALAFGCSHGNSNTRTAGNDTGTTQPSSMNGTQATAAGANGTQGTATASNGATANNGTGTDTNAGAGSTGSYGTSGTASNSNSGTSGTSGSYGSSSTSPSSSASASMNNGSSNGTSSGTGWNNGSTNNAPASGSPSYGASGVASVSNGSPHGTNAPGLSGSAENNPTAGSNDSGSNDSLRTVTGAVAKVDSGSITLDESAGGVTLTVDSNTQITRRGHAVSQGISAIHEGTKVRASFDPASNRADKIEVMGAKKMHKHAADTTTDSNNK